MKYNRLFIIGWIGLGLFLHTTPFLATSMDDLHARHKPSQNFSQFLKDCNYAPVCIKYLRNEYPVDSEKIDTILLQRYKYEYRLAIADVDSLEEKLARLGKMSEFLIAEPHWIDNGYEPYLASTNDGSDRGGAGLRYKALKIVRDEVANTSEK